MSGKENWFCSLRKKKSINCWECQQICFISASGRACSRSHWHRDGNCGANNPDPGLQRIVTGSGALRLPGGAFWSRRLEGLRRQKSFGQPWMEEGRFWQEAGWDSPSMWWDADPLETHVGKSVWITVTEAVKVSHVIKKKQKEESSQARRGETLWGGGGAYENEMRSPKCQCNKSSFGQGVFHAHLESFLLRNYAQISYCLFLQRS